MELSKLAHWTGRKVAMSGVAQDPLAAGREAFSAQQWGRAYELLRAADVECLLAPADLERLSEAACWTRRYDEMLDLLERAEAGFERDRDRRAAARMALKLTQEHYQRNHDAVSGGWLARAAKLLEGEPDCHETGLLLWVRVRGLLFVANDIAGALDHSRELVELARRLGDPDLEALGLLDQGHALIMAGRVQEGSRLLDEATALAMTGATELSTTGTVYCSTIFACRNIGDWQRASEWTSESLRWCDRHSVSGFPGLCRLHRAEIIRMSGSLAEAEQDAQVACEELFGWAPRWAGWAYHELGEVRRRRGDLEGARAAFGRALDVGFDPQPGLALLRLDEADPAGALATINRRMADRDAFTQESRALLLPAQVTIALASGDLDIARAALAEMDEVAGQCGATAILASASVAHGALALAERRPARCDCATARGVAAMVQPSGTVRRGPGSDTTRPGIRPDRRPGRGTVGVRGRSSDVRRAGRPAGGATDPAAYSPGPCPDCARSRRSCSLTSSTRHGWWSYWATMAGTACSTGTTAPSGRASPLIGDARSSTRETGSSLPSPIRDRRWTAGSHCSARWMSIDIEHGFAPRLRIGVHAAEATRRDRDFFGQGVHVAARVAAAGAAGQILTSAATFAAAGDGYSASEPYSLHLKGIAEPLEVVEVDWR